MGIRKKECSECKGSGKIGGLFFKSACVTCDGKGYIIDPNSLSQDERERMGESYRQTGNSLLQQGKPDMAMKKFSLALEYKPSFEAHVGRIIGAQESKNYSAACDYTEILTEIAQTNGNAHYFKCGAYYQRSGTHDSLRDQIDDLRVAYRAIELALYYKCTFKDAKELHLYLRDWLKECEGEYQSNTNYSKSRRP